MTVGFANQGDRVVKLIGNTSAATEKFRSVCGGLRRRSRPRSSSNMYSMSFVVARPTSTPNPRRYRLKTFRSQH